MPVNTDEITIDDIVTVLKDIYESKDEDLRESYFTDIFHFLPNEIKELIKKVM